MPGPSQFRRVSNCGWRRGAVVSAAAHKLGRSLGTCIITCVAAGGGQSVPGCGFPCLLPHAATRTSRSPRHPATCPALPATVAAAGSARWKVGVEGYSEARPILGSLDEVLPWTFLARLPSMPSRMELERARSKPSMPRGGDGVRHKRLQQRCRVPSIFIRRPLARGTGMNHDPERAPHNGAGKHSDKAT